MKLRNVLFALTACAIIGALAGCGKKPSAPVATPASADTAPGQPTGPLPEVQPMMFQRAVDRAAAMLARKEYAQATEALATLNGFKLNPEQQAKVDALKAQIPK